MKMRGDKGEVKRCVVAMKVESNNSLEWTRS
jgi:hypothetical protein